MIEKIIITSLVCLAIHVSMRPGMILSIIGEVIEIFIPEHLSKPLATCLACMASIYGTLMFVFWAGLPVIEYAPFILAVSGLNYLFSLTISILEIFKNAQDEQNNYESEENDD